MKNKETKIIMDTNFLLIPAQFKVDIFSELKRVCDFPYELCVMYGTLKELKFIQKDKEQKGANKRAAKMAMTMLNKQKHTMLDSERRNVDDAIVDYCENHFGIVVATQDIELKKRLKGNKIITLRSRKFLKIE